MEEFLLYTLSLTHTLSHTMLIYTPIHKHIHTLASLLVWVLGIYSEVVLGVSCDWCLGGLTHVHRPCLVLYTPSGPPCVSEGSGQTFFQPTYQLKLLFHKLYITHNSFASLWIWHFPLASGIELGTLHMQSQWSPTKLCSQPFGIMILYLNEQILAVDILEHHWCSNIGVLLLMYKSVPQSMNI